MSQPQPVIVALTDGDTNLSTYLEQMREEGFRVLATSRPYELALFMTRHQVTGLILRCELMGDPPEDLLRPIKELAPETLIVVTGHEESLPDACAPLVDCYLQEPFRLSSLLEVLDYGRAREEERRRRTTGTRSALRLTDTEEEEDHPPALQDRAPRLLECALRLSELERDREHLLTSALEMFLETADAERVSIMLHTRDGKHLEVVRRSGFPADVEAIEPIPIEGTQAGSVAQSGIPTLVEDSDTRTGRGYRSGSYMIVPLMQRRTAIGVVNLTNPRGGAAFDNDTLELVTSIARQLAVCLSNASLLSDLKYMTIIDPLTELYNRRYFDRQIDAEVQRARRTRRTVTLALLDIDKFKLVNDFNGYVTGDAVLEQVAEVIKANVRELDIVTRWGGDEFALLLPDTAGEAGKHSASSAIERVLQAVRDTDFREKIPGLTGRITLSAGIAAFPADCDDRKSLFALANKALGKAKSHGGNALQLTHAPLEGEAAADA